MDGWMDGRTDGRAGGRMGGRTDKILVKERYNNNHIVSIFLDR